MRLMRRSLGAVKRRVVPLPAEVGIGQLADDQSVALA